MKNGDFPYLSKRLPEGKPPFSHGFPMIFPFSDGFASGYVSVYQAGSVPAWCTTNFQELLRVHHHDSAGTLVDLWSIRILGKYEILAYEYVYVPF